MLGLYTLHAIWHWVGGGSLPHHTRVTPPPQKQTSTADRFIGVESSDDRAMSPERSRVPRPPRDSQRSADRPDAGSLPLGLLPDSRVEERGGQSYGGWMPVQSAWNWNGRGCLDGGRREGRKHPEQPDPVAVDCGDETLQGPVGLRNVNWNLNINCDDT